VLWQRKGELFKEREHKLKEIKEKEAALARRAKQKLLLPED
jgi:hypothetical protein